MKRLAAGPPRPLPRPHRGGRPLRRTGGEEHTFVFQGAEQGAGRTLTMGRRAKEVGKQGYMMNEGLTPDALIKAIRVALEAGMNRQNWKCVADASALFEALISLLATRTTTDAREEG